VIETNSLLISAALFLVPWQAGTQEAGKALIFGLCGLSPASGFAVGLIQRLRDMIWAGIGLLCLATFRDNDSRPDISFEITTSFSLISQGVSPPSAGRRLDSRSTHSSPTLNDPAPLRP
jgi:hypothetical protein